MNTKVILLSTFLTLILFSISSIAQTSQDSIAEEICLQFLDCVENAPSNTEDSFMSCGLKILKYINKTYSGGDKKQISQKFYTVCDKRVQQLLDKKGKDNEMKGELFLSDTLINKYNLKAEKIIDNTIFYKNKDSLNLNENILSYAQKIDNYDPASNEINFLLKNRNIKNLNNEFGHRVEFLFRKEGYFQQNEIDEIANFHTQLLNQKTYSVLIFHKGKRNEIITIGNKKYIEKIMNEIITEAINKMSKD